VPGRASGQGGMAATLGQDTGSALRPLTTDFHEPGFASGLAQEDAFTQAKGFRFQLSDHDKQQGDGAKWQWGPQNPQALNRYSYVLDNPLRYTDPTGHCGLLCIPAAVAAYFTAEVLLEVAAAFVVVSFVSAVITCSQDPGCSSVLPEFANQLNQGAITVQEFLGGIQRSLAGAAEERYVRRAARRLGADQNELGKAVERLKGYWGLPPNENVTIGDDGTVYHNGESIGNICDEFKCTNAKESDE
jgi:hypothetical protein